MPREQSRKDGESKIRSRKKTAKSSENTKDVSKENPNKASTFKLQLKIFCFNCVICLAVSIYLYPYYFYLRERHLAKQTEHIDVRSGDVPCSEKYKAEIQAFPGCVPVRCGRMVSDKLVTPEEVDHVLEIGKRGLNLGGSDGGASILDLHSGALSHGKSFVNIYKIDEAKDLFTASDFKIYKQVRSKIQSAIAEHFGIDEKVLHLTHPTFFSRLTSDPPSTPHDEYWHPHVDKETYESFHYTSLLYLNTFGEDYTGGRFLFIDPDNHTQIVEPKKGRVSMFTSGWENVHLVERVASGTRYALTISFTCDLSHAIKDPS
ncbi:hypothetical protein LSTR_LSTR002318 [Laodelphax striatellus]|uniref:Fe2OG dioxygenase domain-containing protein n=1 Tax=Laodelphax striatellus TaxID=195883 RepID=A0A482XEU0_LAOST|nr:hypothetical protein LSTR_LSTR002318 [Laodelphax striatellus]